MGGSGGSGYFGGDVSRTIKQLQDASQKAHDAEYEAQSNELLHGLLSAFNDRNVDAINVHLGEIEKALGKELEGTIDVVFGGSVAKHTYVDGLSDVDSLVMLDNCELAEANPSEAKDYLAMRLRERFPDTEISEGRLAVTISFSDAEIQLLPAVSCRNVVHIPDSSGAGWAQIRPREFMHALTDCNDQIAKKVVPVIKLAKAVIANLPEPQQINGYHAEALAVDVFSGYEGSRASKDMLHHYFTEASRLVLKPIVDKTGQSTHVDGQLGEPASLERKIISDAFSRVARRMERADASSRADDWRTLFGELAGGK